MRRLLVVRVLRYLLDMSQTDLGQELGLSQPMISFIENGKQMPEAQAERLMAFFRGKFPGKIPETVSSDVLQMRWEEGKTLLLFTTDDLFEG